MMERPIQKGGRRGRSSYEERGKVKNGSKKKIRGRKKGGGETHGGQWSRKWHGGYVNVCEGNETGVILRQAVTS